jgi:hypothetical protein
MNATRRIALAAATLGAAYCIYLLIGFFGVIAGNRLPWEGSAQFTREHYLAVGQAYSRGFAVGFFFCFCLALIAMLVGTWYERSIKGQAAILIRGDQAHADR